MATRIKRKSEKERDNNGTVSFLRLPCLLILGDGGAVECGVLQDDDDTVVDNKKYSVLYCILFRSFV